MFHWSKHGTENIALLVNPLKSGWAIRNCWNIMFWTLCITDLQSLKRKDICSDLSKPPNFSNRLLWIGSKWAFKYVDRVITCWICWFIEKIWITCIWITTSIWNPSRHWPLRNVKNPGKYYFSYSKKIFISPGFHTYYNCRNSRVYLSILYMYGSKGVS